MPRKIVLCCDGTANEFATDRTNVIKLFATLVHEPARQVTYYHPGVGTMEPPGALTKFSRAVTKVLGQAIGYGLESDIRDAYVFLMNHFKEGDRLFMFGFNRILRLHGKSKHPRDSLRNRAGRRLGACLENGWRHH